MVFIVAMVLIMFNSKKDALVDNDYYEKGVHYDAEYGKKEQMFRDHAQPVVSLSRDLILLTFKAPAKGTLRLMRTADKNLDRSIGFESNALDQAVMPATQLKKGSWRLIVDWKSNDKSYLYEKEITL